MALGSEDAVSSRQIALRCSGSVALAGAGTRWGRHVTLSSLFLGSMPANPLIPSAAGPVPSRTKGPSPVQLKEHILMPVHIISLLVVSTG